MGMSGLPDMYTQSLSVFAGIDCGFSLTGNIQCITFIAIVKDTHFNCGFWYHFCTAK